MRFGIQSLRAALTESLAHSFSGESAARQEVELSQATDEKVFAPKVRELIELTRAAQEVHAEALAKKQAAEEVLRLADLELEELAVALSERQRELARAGAAAPADFFPEELRAKSAERQRRVLRAHVELCGEAVTGRAAELREMKRRLNESFAQFGRDEYLKAQEAFQEAAKEARRVFSHMAAFFMSFHGVAKLRTLPYIIIEDPLFQTTKDQFLVHCLRENTDHVADADLRVCLTALRAEIRSLGSHGASVEQKEALC